MPRGTRASGAGAYGLALVLVHRGLHLPDLLPVWKDEKMTHLVGTTRNQRLETKTHPPLVYLGLCTISFQ